MITPNTRALLTLDDLRLVSIVVWSHRLTDDEAAKLIANRDLLNRTLDDKRILHFINTFSSLDRPSPRLYFYLTARHALLKENVTDDEIADYVAALLLEFGMRDRAFRLGVSDDAIYQYFIDLNLDGISESQPWRKFNLHAHLGNMALWMAGLFPQHIQNKRCLSLRYVDGIGRKGYLKASLNPKAKQLEMDKLFEKLVDSYSCIRLALNDIGEQTWPTFH